MQHLLNVCSEYASYWCIKYNERKMKLMYFGKGFENFECSTIFLNGVPLEFVPEWKYLGVVMTSDKSFVCSVQKPRSAFCHSANSILNVLNKPSNDVLLRLLYSICVPNITYACEVVEYRSKDVEGLHVLVNDAIRRIFSFNRWESIRSLRESFGYLSVTEIFAKRRRAFNSQLPNIGNPLLTSLSTL